MESAEQKRKFFRVPAKVRVFFCPETFEARQAMITDYTVWANQAPELPESLRRNFTDLGTVHEKLQPIYRLMQWIDFKLDTLVFQMRTMSSNQAFTNYLITKDVSTTGFGFNHHIGLPLGTRLLLAMHLPDDPVRPLYTVGVLIRNSHPPSSDATPANQEGSGAIRFEELTDIDEERITRFCFNYERILKQKKTLYGDD